MSKDLYETLGVDRNSSQEEINTAYKKLAKQYHPDRPTGDAEKFKEISSAYETLKDPQKRKQYDTFGSTDGNFTGGAGGFDSDFFQNIFNGFGGGGNNGGFTTFFSSNGGGRSASVRGRDLQLNDTLTLEDLFFGKNITVTFDTYVHCSPCKASGFSGRSSCSVCKGKGFTTSGFDIFNFRHPCEYCNQTGQNIKDTCKKCNGEGRVRERVQHLLKVPKGYDITKPLIYHGLGEAGVRGGKNSEFDGDLIVKLSLERHNIFQKINNDLHMTQQIDLHSAVLGTEIKVIGIDKQEYFVKVPPLNTNTSITVDNAGFWLSNKSSRRGNLVINIQIIMPIVKNDIIKSKFLDFWNSVKN